MTVIRSHLQGNFSYMMQNNYKVKNNKVKKALLLRRHDMCEYEGLTYLALTLPHPMVLWDFPVVQHVCYLAALSSSDQKACCYVPQSNSLT